MVGRGHWQDEVGAGLETRALVLGDDFAADVFRERGEEVGRDGRGLFGGGAVAVAVAVAAAGPRAGRLGRDEVGLREGREIAASGG